MKSLVSRCMSLHSGYAIGDPVTTGDCPEGFGFMVESECKRFALPGAFFDTRFQNSLRFLNPHSSCVVSADFGKRYPTGCFMDAKMHVFYNTNPAVKTVYWNSRPLCLPGSFFASVRKIN